MLSCYPSSCTHHLCVFYHSVLLRSQVVCHCRATTQLWQDTPGMYQVHTWYIPDKSHSQASLDSILARKPQTGTSCGAPQFWTQRARPRKAGAGQTYPQPGVDLIDMAAPPRGRACTIGTAAPKTVLSAAVLLWERFHFHLERIESEELIQGGLQPFRRSRVGTGGKASEFRWIPSFQQALKKTKSSGMLSP